MGSWSEYNWGDFSGVQRASRDQVYSLSNSNSASSSATNLINNILLFEAHNTICSVNDNKFTRPELLLEKLHEHVAQNASCFDAIPDSAQSAFSFTRSLKVENGDQGFDKSMPAINSTKEISRGDLARRQNNGGIESSATHVRSIPLTRNGKNASGKSTPKVEFSSCTVRADSNANSSTTNKKRGNKTRKIQQRRIMCVPVIGGGGSWNKQGGARVPSDLWGWRKYGQKTIKGSPYPRGYYKCSSSKGCPAKKQIERSHSDPTMLVVTYTADHSHAFPTHRNALARFSSLNAFPDIVQALSVPHSANQKSGLSVDIPAEGNPDSKCSVDQSSHSTQGKGETNSSLHPDVVRNSLDEEDKSAGLYVFKHDADLFADLWELPGLYLSDFVMRSDEETASAVVDTFKHFN